MDAVLNNLLNNSITHIRSEVLFCTSGNLVQNQQFVKGVEEIDERR